jgi:hypothetical protein
MLLHLPALSQNDVPGHSLSGSAHSMVPHVPGSFVETTLLQVRQSPVHVELQHTPSTQKPLAHCEAAEHGAPSPSLHAPAAQTWPAVQSALTAQEVAHDAPAQET